MNRPALQVRARINLARCARSKFKLAFQKGELVRAADLAAEVWRTGAEGTLSL
ncbi:hypothetical protein [Streptomyces sp. NBC_00503]|uniref:hypothetical protein n=1 Tax=Streptomyces sp. NBC_00503 TaxID=2903659 RepID=UPI002E7FCE8E|nr:hypothetical protein [Streptomyces sp. NBC_00503]WUD79229.1 hypothetical protein OG490_00810 [Streptomyces sp. NBC_00503]